MLFRGTYRAGGDNQCTGWLSLAIRTGRGISLQLTNNHSVALGAHGGTVPLLEKGNKKSHSPEGGHL